jgi:WD40 repeat protein
VPTITALAFADDSHLYSAGLGGIRRWDVASGHQELVISEPQGGWFDAVIRPDLNLALTRSAMVDCAPIVARNLAGGAPRELTAFGSCVAGFDLDRSGTIVAAGDRDGLVHVGRLTDGEPHLLVGHKGAVAGVKFSPDDKWVVSEGNDNTLRLWPLPDLDTQPFHTLRHDELLAQLRTLTNLRAVRDASSAIGWKIELGPFPGWREVPTWRP